MKHLFLAALFLLTSQSNFAQIRTKTVIKPVVKPEKIVQYANEIDVYIAIQDGIYTTDEIYELFRGENPKIKLMAYSYGAPSINPQVTAINGVFPSLFNNYQTIAFKLKIANTDKLTTIVACIDEQELANKDAQIEIDFKNESCSGALSKNNILGIENNFAGIYKKFNNAEKGCGYIRSNEVDKSIIFRISKINHEK
jgi:hypothetical protein